MEKHWLPGSTNSIVSAWVCASANACSVGWNSDCANRDPLSRRRIQIGSDRTKKTPDADARELRRSVVHRRSAFPTALFALSQGGPAGNQRPCPAACPHAQERGIFRGGPVARWPLRIPSGRGQVQWNKLLPLSS